MRGVLVKQSKSATYRALFTSEETLPRQATRSAFEAASALPCNGNPLPYMQVALAVNAMSTCGLIHAALMKTGKMYVAESEEAEFMKRCREFALQCVSHSVHRAPWPTIALSPPMLLFSCFVFCGQALWWRAFPFAKVYGGMVPSRVVA